MAEFVKQTRQAVTNEDGGRPFVLSRNQNLLKDPLKLAALIAHHPGSIRNIFNQNAEQEQDQVTEQAFKQYQHADEAKKKLGRVLENSGADTSADMALNTIYDSTTY